MKKSHLLLSLFLVLTLFVISCTKQGPEGNTGPAGTQGPKGDEGTDGTNGTNGTNGADGANGANGANGADGTNGAQGPAGTANVIYSKWFTNDEFSLPWADSSITALTPETIARAIKFAPDLTSGILDSGIVLSYVRATDVLISPQLLPWLFSFDDVVMGVITCQMNLVPQVGGILYYMSNQTTHDATGLWPGTGFEYRYIIIPGGVLAGGRKINPKILSYSELCRTYHIPQ